MKAPDPPPDEKARLATLRRLQLLDTPAEERFDRLTRLARRTLGTEIALVSLVDEDRQWFKSAQGLAATETGRDISFCGHAILGEKTLCVPDASQDERFADNPLVTGDPNIRLYAGHPICAEDGSRIGTLCVIDSQPRQLDAEELASLRDIAALVENEIRLDTLSRAQVDLRSQLDEAERRAAVDALTRVWNRGAIEKFISNEFAKARRRKRLFGVAMVDLDHFKLVNDTHGHAAGDQVLRVVSRRFRASLRKYDSVGRWGGEEFVVGLTECTEESATALAERLRNSISEAPIATENGAVQVTASVGLCVAQPRLGQTWKDFVNAADKALYNAKSAGRNRVGRAMPED